MSEEYERRRDAKELYMWMGNTTKAIENIEKMNERDSEQIKEINHKINQAIVCPYTDEIKKIQKEVGTCKTDRTILKRDRKYIYIGFAAMFSMLGGIIKRLWT